ncbi:MAG: histidine kinase dimerization/phospho-acceptor domain-containing protein [Limisphaerales bacterium]
MFLDWPIRCYAGGVSSYDSIYKKMAASLEQSGAEMPHDALKPDLTRYISPTVAHELNNVITVIQGYTDQLLLKHREDPALQPQLKLISKAARRAADIVSETMTSAAPTTQIVAQPGQNPSQQSQSRART